MPLLPLWALVACYRVTFTFTLHLISTPPPVNVTPQMVSGHLHLQAALTIRTNGWSLGNFLLSERGEKSKERNFHHTGRLVYRRFVNEVYVIR